LKRFKLNHLSIRVKLTLPYVLLSLLIATGGGLIVTQLMLDSVEQRFTNQLLETRKLASELMVHEEDRLLETLRLLAYTEGVPAAIVQRDHDQIMQLVYPVTFNAGEDVVLVLDEDGTVLAAMLRVADTNEYQFPQIDEKVNTFPFVAKLVNQEVDEMGDKYSGVSDADWGAYFFVSGPVNDQEGNLVGVILVGKSLSGIVYKIREETLAQATIYDMDFIPISSTFVDLPSKPDIKPETVLERKEKETLLRDLTSTRVAYTEVVSAWEIRDGEDIGILGTALPKDFLVQASRLTRWNVILQIVLAITAAILLGGWRSAKKNNPTHKIKTTANEI